MGKTKQLNVPTDAFHEFAGLVGMNKLRAKIDGADKTYGAIVVTVEYEPDERATVHYLEDFVEDRWLEFEERKANG